MRKKIFKMMLSMLLAGLPIAICGCQRAPESSQKGGVLHAKDAVEDAVAGIVAAGNGNRTGAGNTAGIEAETGMGNATGVGTETGMGNATGTEMGNATGAGTETGIGNATGTGTGGKRIDCLIGTKENGIRIQAAAPDIPAHVPRRVLKENAALDRGLLEDFLGSSPAAVYDLSKERQKEAERIKEENERSPERAVHTVFGDGSICVLSDGEKEAGFLNHTGGYYTDKALQEKCSSIYKSAEETALAGTGIVDVVRIGNMDAAGKADAEGNVDTTGKADTEGNMDATGKADAEGNVDTTGKADTEGNMDAEGKADAEGNMDAAGKAGIVGNPDFPVRDAEALLLDKLAKINLAEIFIYEVTMYQRKGFVFYEVKFTPSYDGVGGVYGLGSDSLEIKLQHGTAWICPDGVAKLELDACLGKEERKPDARAGLLSWEQLVKILEVNLREGKLHGSSEAVLTKAEFLYYPLFHKEKNEVELVAAWHLYLPLAAWAEDEGLSGKIMEGGALYSICVDAVSGELLRVD